MAQYTITEEQIKSIAEGGGKKKIKEMFPEVFNPKLEDKTWYIYPDGSIQFNEKDGYGYGINAGKDWVEEARWIRNENNSVFKKATKEEVLEALIPEAKRRYTIGDELKNHQSDNLFLKDLDTNKIRYSESPYNGIWYDDGNRGFWLFFKGKWAEKIIKQITLSKAEAEAKLTELSKDGFEYKIFDGLTEKSVIHNALDMSKFKLQNTTL